MPEFGPGSLLNPLTVVGATPVEGTPKIDGTQDLIAWEAPADGQLHMVSWSYALDVTVNESGGSILLSFNSGGAPRTFYIDSGSNPASGWQPGSVSSFLGTGVIPVDPGSPVVVSQDGALTAGASTMFLQLMGS